MELLEQRKYLDLINESGLRKGFIADKIGITNAKLSLYINGREEMPIEIQSALNDILNV